MNESTKYNRRDFLGRSICGMFGLFYSWKNGWLEFSDLIMDEKTLKLGRILVEGAPSHPKPDQRTKVVNSYAFNTIIEYEEIILTKTSNSANELWLKLPDSRFIAAKYVQMVENRLNKVEQEISTSGRLAEVTVPYTTARPRKSNFNNPNIEQSFFYGSTHWVHGLGTDQKGTLYYIIIEDRWSDAYYVDAAHMHILSDEELAPINADVNPEAKRIKVNLREQYLMAFEKDEPIFLSPISTGISRENLDLSTPTGDFRIIHKRPSRHMIHSEDIGINDKELYGVPWVSFFTNNGIAFHGTYWHNDFSQPNSHGCINLPMQAARWLYLWANPALQPRQKEHITNIGTYVEVR